MVFDLTSYPKVLTLYLELSQYPILAPTLRRLMRKELFEKGIITPEAFEAEALEKAIQTQEREGLKDPAKEETPDIWSMRLTIIRDQLTDFYFAYNLPHERFEELVRQVLADRGSKEEVVLTFHPELAPWEMLFSQGEAYETLPRNQRTQVEHHLREIKVVLIKAMISDHLEYLGIAKNWFDIADLSAIRDQRIGRGKIGGKAAGVMLAESILRKSASQEILERLQVPRSWFLAADIFYQFTQMNNLLGYANQKYKDEDEIRSDYPSIIEAFENGLFPQEILDGLKRILEDVAQVPLIVRSSSLLEDSFGTSFAGKYESYFCPNQGTPKENLIRLLDAIRRVYAGVYSPNVLLYRRQKGLIDYDERMAILIQEVQGRQHNGFYFPDAAGVAFSRNQFRWSPRIDRTAGFLRLVWGLGTRAVDNVAGDYPRMVALSHPNLRPQTEPREIHRYSQHQIDLVDLEENEFRTVTISEAIESAEEIPHLRLIGQRYDQSGVLDFVMKPTRNDAPQTVITFDGLLKKTRFPELAQQMLATLEEAYLGPVDVEFALSLDFDDAKAIVSTIHLLQCRPQSRLQLDEVKIPKGLPPENQLLITKRMVPNGKISDIRYVIYVPANHYANLAGSTSSQELAQFIGKLNSKLAGESFILIGPGRWGSSNSQLGIPVSYADIYNARAIVEVFGIDSSPEPSYGTHFFQDLVEAQIYPLAIGLSDPDSEINLQFFEEKPNSLDQIMENSDRWEEVVRLIDVPEVADGSMLEMAMDGDSEIAMIFLQPRPGTEQATKDNNV